MMKSFALVLLVQSLAISSRAARVETDAAGNLVASGNKVLLKEEGSAAPVDVLGELKIAARKTVENAVSSGDNAKDIANNTKKIGNAAKEIGENTKDIATNLEKITLARRDTAANSACDANTGEKMTTMVGTLADLIKSNAAAFASTAEKQTDMVGTLAKLISSGGGSSSDDSAETTAALHAYVQCDYSDDAGACTGDGENFAVDVIALARNLVPTEASAPHDMYTCEFTFTNPNNRQEIKLAKVSSTTAAAVEYVPNSDSAYKVTCRLPAVSELAVGTALDFVFALKAGCRTITLPKCSSGPWSFKITKTDRDFFYLIVGGGGGGGGGQATSFAGGGGGAGGYKSNIGHSSVSLSAGDTLIVKVGKGGKKRLYGSQQGYGGSGGGSSLTIDYKSSTTANAIHAVDGGGGGGDGSFQRQDMAGADGASGGGAGGNQMGRKYGGKASGNGAGNTGGWAQGSRGGSGGGGAKGAGSFNAAGQGYQEGAKGGEGIVNKITGESIIYSQGGKGGSMYEKDDRYRTVDPEVPYTGEGGMGARGASDCDKCEDAINQNKDSAAGGSGVVIIRILSQAYTKKISGQVAVTIDGEHTVLTFTSDGTYTA